MKFVLVLFLLLGNIKIMGCEPKSALNNAEGQKNIVESEQIIVLDAQEENVKIVGCEPKALFDDNEGRKKPAYLKKFHKSLAPRGFDIFMPKNTDEMDWVLSKNEWEKKYGSEAFYEEEKFLKNESHDDDETFAMRRRNAEHKFINHFWACVTGYISGELFARFAGGDLFFIEKFLQYFDDFMDMTKLKKYKEISRPLFNNPIGHSDLESNIMSCLGGMKSYGGNSEYMHYIALRLDAAFERAEMPLHPSFSYFYGMNGFAQSKECKRIENQILKIFSKDGISIPLGTK